jgi:endonuclease G
MKRLIQILLFLPFVFTYAQVELPKYQPDEQIIHHIGYSLSYNENHEQANWVAYELTENEVKGSVKRNDAFRSDPMISTGSAELSDYKGSGYDRGHLAPAADMKWSALAMSESFYMSNMSPQDPSFNRGIWKRLESQVRQWAMDNGSVYVATGGLLLNGLNTIGSSSVSVPKYYYKVVLDYQDSDYKAIGFLMPNAASKQNLQDFAVTIDNVELITGIDFFHSLPDGIENSVESTISVSKWTFSTSKQYKNTQKSIKSSSSTAAQCLGYTKKGSRCKRKTKDLSGYCYQHK